MKLPQFSGRGEVGDDVELSEELSDHFAGVVTLAELIDLLHHPGQHVFDLFDGAV